VKRHTKQSVRRRGKRENNLRESPIPKDQKIKIRRKRRK